MAALDNSGCVLAIKLFVSAGSLVGVAGVRPTLSPHSRQFVPVILLADEGLVQLGRSLHLDFSMLNVTDLRIIAFKFVAV
jgi:hypothetical protein